LAPICSGCHGIGLKMKGGIAYGIEAAALSGEIAEFALQTRRVVIDLSGVEMISAAGLGALISVPWRRRPASALFGFETNSARGCKPDRTSNHRANCPV
jgi:hypothetical protein